MFKGRELSNKSFQMDSLDGLRGFAVLIVFLSHTSNDGIFLFPHIDFSGIGKSGVYLFFILSSFLLTYPFIKKPAEATSSKFLLNYSLRRFFRIYPLYFIYLLTGLVSSYFLASVFSLDEKFGIPFYLTAKDFFDHLLLIQGKGVTWSIVVEFRYYFVLPVLALTYSVILKNKLIPSVLLTILLIVIVSLLWPASESVPKDKSLGPYLPIFISGSLLAVIFYNWQQSDFSRNTKIVLSVEISGLIALAILILMIPSVSSYVYGKKILFNHYHKDFLSFAVLWSVVVFSCVVGSGMVTRFFESSFLRYLGFISFSVYLTHEVAMLVVMSLVKRTGIDSLVFIQGWLMLLLAIVVSHISWSIIEMPASRIRLYKNNA